MSWEPEDKKRWCGEAISSAMVDGINLFSRDTLVGQDLLSEAYWDSEEAIDLRASIVEETKGRFARQLESTIDSWTFGASWRVRWLFEAAITAAIDAWCTELVAREALSVDFTSQALRSRRIAVMRLFAKRGAEEVEEMRREKLLEAPRA